MHRRWRTPNNYSSYFCCHYGSQGARHFFIKHWESDELDKKLDRSFASGCKIVGMDIDAAGLITLRKMGHPVGPKSPKKLAAIVEKVHTAGCKLILKGITSNVVFCA